MCNLYRMTAPADAVAKLFSATPAPGANYVPIIAPTDPGLVIVDRRVRAMTWGFPRIDNSKVTGKPLKPKAVNNVRFENLVSPFWRSSFAARRCLIPVTAWAEPEGEQGSRTQTWLSLPDEEIFAVGGIWRQTVEWGNAYSMMMVPGNAQMKELHDRMPVILRRDEWDQWTDGTPEEARALCRPWDGALVVDATDMKWGERPLPPPL